MGRDSRDLPPDAASANDSPWRLAPPADPETYARFAAAFARRYQDTIRYYQIWDEPNIAPHWGNRLIDPVGYARLLQEAARAVRAADPDAVILAAALAPTQDRGHTAIDEGFFLQRLYAAGAAPYFDAVLVQPFGFGTGPQDTRSRVDALNFHRAAWIRKVMVAAGDSQTPVWAVRFGWNRLPQDQWKTVSEPDQLRFTAEAIQYAKDNWPWLAALGWPIDRPDAPVSDPMWGFSLISADNKEHPLLSVFSDASQATPVPMPSHSEMNTYARLALQLLAVGLLLWWAAGILRSLPPAPLESCLPGSAPTRQTHSLGPSDCSLLPCCLAAPHSALLARRRLAYRRRANRGANVRGRYPSLPLPTQRVALHRR